MSDAADAAELAASARAWIAADPDPATRAELEGLLARSDTAALRARFAEPLEFGTAGLRGELGAGPARMNRLVVRNTTRGLARWLGSRARSGAPARLVVGRDARHGSASFATETVATAASEGLEVRVIPEPLPTPVTAFALRHLDAAAAVMVTASHNPARDNGYKVYLADGAQVVPPFDEEIAALASAGALTPEPSSDLPGRVSDVDVVDLLDAYRSRMGALVDPNGPRDLRIVYTPLHGVGGALATALLADAGFDAPAVVAEQYEPDPDFPTVSFPNPEEPGALDLSFALARRLGADLVLANDPDADRLAVGVFDPAAASWRRLTGDEVGILLGAHLIDCSSGDDRLVATTIVSSTMLSALAREEGVAYAETLTGFKWIARAAATSPGHRLLFGYEEALGYAVSDAVADKDGMSAALVVAALAASAKAKGTTLLDLLDGLAVRLGVHDTAQWSLRLEGAGATARMAAIVTRLRSGPPDRLAGRAVTEVVDLAHGSATLPPTDALVLVLEGGGRVVVRPSGTEPKLKAYLEIATSPPGASGLAAARAEARRDLEALRDDVARHCVPG